MRLWWLCLLFFICPGILYAAYKQPPILIPRLEELTSIVANGTSQEKIKSLQILNALSEKKYWRRDENWQPLVALLKDSSPLVRAEAIHYCTTLARRGRNGQFNPFIHPIANPAVHSKILPRLRLGLRDAVAEVRRESCKAIAEYKDRIAAPLLDLLLDDPNLSVQLEAVHALGVFSGIIISQESIDHLIRLIGQDKPWPHVLLQHEALQTLWHLGVSREKGTVFYPILQKRLSNPYLTSKVIQQFSLQKMAATPEARGFIFSMLHAAGNRIPLLVLQSLENMSPPSVIMGSAIMRCPPLDTFSELVDTTGKEIDVVAQISPCLQSGYPEIQESATRVLGRINNPEATEKLIQLAQESDQKIRSAALHGLRYRRDKQTRKDKRIVALLRDNDDDPEKEIRPQAIKKMPIKPKAAGKPESETVLLKKIHDSFTFNRLDAAEKLLKYYPSPNLLADIIPYLSDKGMVDIFRKCVGYEVEKTVYGYRDEYGERVILADKPPVKRYWKKTVHDQAVELLLGYLATCVDHCRPWQQQLALFEHQDIEPYFLELTKIGNNREKYFTIKQLAVYATPKSLPRLITLLDDPDKQVRKTIFKTIARLHFPAFVPVVLEKLQASDKLMRRLAIKAAGWFSGYQMSTKILNGLAPLLDDPDSLVRVAVVSSMGQLGNPAAAEYLIRLLEDPSEKMRAKALRALSRLDDPRLLENIITMLQDDSEHVRKMALYLIGTFGKGVYVDEFSKKFEYQRIVAMLIGLRENQNKNSMMADYSRVVCSSMTALGNIGGKEAVVGLVQALDDGLNGRCAYNALNRGFTWDEVRGFLQEHENGKELLVLFEHQFPEEEALLKKLKKLCKDVPCGMSRYSLERRIRAGTLKIKQEQDIVDLVLQLLADEKNKGEVRHAIKDLGRIGDRRALQPLLDIMEAECKVAKISPIMQQLTNAVIALGDRDIIPFLVKELDCSDPLAEMYIEGGLRRHFTTEEIFSDLKQNSNFEELTAVYNRHFHPGFRKIQAASRQPSATDDSLQNDKDKYNSSSETSKASQLQHSGKLLPPPSLSMADGFRGRSVYNRKNKSWNRPVQHRASALQPSEGKTGQETPNAADAAKKCDEHRAKLVVILAEQSDGHIWSLQELADYQKQLNHTEAKERRIAADWLGDSNEPTVAQSLIPLLCDQDKYVRQAAARALGKLRADTALEQLLPLLDDNDVYVRIWTAFALQRLEIPLASRSFTEFMEKADSVEIARINMIIAGYP